MTKHVYWVGSVDPVYHPGLQRFLARGSAVEAELVPEADDDGRWAKSRPKGCHPFADDVTGEDATAASAAPQEVKTDG